MWKVLAVCGNGMGTSTLMKMKVKNVFKKHNIEATFESCSVGEAQGIVNQFDIVITSNHLLDELKAKEGTHLIGLQNLLSEQELEPKVLAVLNK